MTPDATKPALWSAGFVIFNPFLFNGAGLESRTMQEYHNSTAIQNSESAPAHVFVTDKETRKIKTNHQQLAHVINRMTARLGFPDKAARCVAGLHGLLNGRETHSFPALIAHKYAARQFNYTGKEENSDVFMGRFLDALKDAEIKAGRNCFEIERANGVTTIITTYHADYIGEAALWALTEARASAEWQKHPAKAVTDELIDRAIARLPVRTAPPPREQSDGASITDGAIIKGLWTKIDTLTEATLRKVALAGGDPLAELEKVQLRQRRIAVEVRREQLERDRLAKEAEYYATLDWLADTHTHTDGKNISDNSQNISTGGDHPSDADHPTICRMDLAKVQQKQHVFSEVAPNGDSANGDPPKLLAALASITEGIPVLAVWGVADGMCDCPKGSECRTPGKHPCPRFAPHGVHSATLDKALVRMWYAKDPRINFGQAMGGDLNLVCIDIDPRNGGSESYFDLVQHYGEDAFPETREKTTGGNGWHKLYRLSKPITGNGEVKAKLAPGIDVKGAGGMIVAPLGDHVSGRTYGHDTGREIALAPVWMEERIIKAVEAESAPEPIKFQADKGRASASTAGGRHFPKGERNDGLRDVACGRWIYGFAADAHALFEQVREVRDTRCEHVPGDPPPTDAEVWDLTLRTVRKYARGESQRQGMTASV
jgi:hypothetical protein